ncbi:MAG: DUF308 domain-containing protein [Clostridia bacterium]|nr:DUF308 domain-containing protein [Clostridia bacterium]
MEQLKKVHWDMLLTSIICILLGGVLIFFPQAVNEMIVYVLAAAMFIFSIVELYNYFKKDVKQNFYRNDLVFAVVALVVGIIVLAKRHAVIELVPIVLGAFIIVSGIKKLQNGLDLIRLKIDGWKSLLVLAAVNIIFGIIMVVCSSQTATTVTVLIGVGLVFSGATDLFSQLWVSKNAKNFDEATENNSSTDLMNIDNK